MAAFHVRWPVCSALPCKSSPCFSQVTTHPPHFIVSHFAYFARVSVRWTCCEENLPSSTEATYASWLVQLCLRSCCWLLPACNQWSVRQRSRGSGGINDYLWSATSHSLSYPWAPFITAAGCHCCGRKHAHDYACTQMLSSICTRVLLDAVLAEKNKNTHTYIHFYNISCFSV